MNRYEVHGENGNFHIVEAEEIKETDNVILFFAKGEVVAIVPLLNIAVVKKIIGEARELINNE